MICTDIMRGDARLRKLTPQAISKVKYLGIETLFLPHKIIYLLDT